MKTLLESHDSLLEYIRCSNSYTTEIPYGRCAACGGVGPYRFTQVVNAKLASQWGLSPEERKAMSSRESMFCAFCRCSNRLRNLALAFTLALEEGKTSKPPSLQELIGSGKLDMLKVAEINSCGQLHSILKDIPQLHYSEYNPTDKTIPHQDLMDLTYADESFDIVLTSDTLEHVPNPERALREIKRVLKKGGLHIFTVPALLDRPGRRRVEEGEDNPKYNGPKSYHGSGEPDYLVWNEFGADFIELIDKTGFDTKVYFTNIRRLGDPSYVFVSQRPKGTAQPQQHSKHVSVDPTVVVEGDPSKYLKNRKIIRSTTAKLSKEDELQVKKVQLLVEKQKFSNQHIDNIESMLKECKTYIVKLENDIHKLENDLRIVNAKLSKIHNSRLIGPIIKITRKHRP